MTHTEKIFMLAGIDGIAPCCPPRGEKIITVAQLAKHLSDSTIGGRQFNECPLGMFLLDGSRCLGDFGSRIRETLDPMVDKRYGDYVLTAEGDGDQRQYKVRVII